MDLSKITIFETTGAMGWIYGESTNDTIKGFNLAASESATLTAYLAAAGMTRSWAWQDMTPFLAVPEMIFLSAVPEMTA